MSFYRSSILFGLLLLPLLYGYSFVLFIRLMHGLKNNIIYSYMLALYMYCVHVIWFQCRMDDKSRYVGSAFHRICFWQVNVTKNTSNTQSVFHSSCSILFYLYVAREKRFDWKTIYTVRFVRLLLFFLCLPRWFCSFKRLFSIYCQKIVE